MDAKQRFTQKTASIVKLLRPEQYYKNLVIFLAIFFSGKLFEENLLLLLALGFFSLCLASSSAYILNDILDRKRDALNSEKSGRPIAHGDISIITASLISLLLVALSLSASYFINKLFFLSVSAYLVISACYSLFMKNEILLDIITISVNFVIRAISGAFIANVWISPWLVMGTFFLALFMATGKRKCEFVFLGRNATKHRKVLSMYSKEITDSLACITTTALLMSYALYCFLVNSRLMVTLPIVVYAILRYLLLIYSGSEKARMPGKMLLDKRMLASVAIYAVISFFAI